MRDFRLYVILDVDIAASCGKIEEIAHNVLSAGADILQLRAKGKSDSEVLKIGRSLGNLARKEKALFILNDRVELVDTINADGVHLGQEDAPFSEARRALGPKRIIGISTHSVEEAHEAERQGVDYIAIGPIFSTQTKPQSTPLGPEIITEIKDKVKIPFLAVGGINLENSNQVLTCGARRIAVCRAIIKAKDVFGTTEKFKQRLNNPTYTS
ncbi:MAG: thiamine phosphate synthase [Candidatus Omnitrophota bacterium]|nr:MAG: thiamine phosphate synthase [Candidatus Omnitrophota bacterium]